MMEKFNELSTTGKMVFAGCAIGCAAVLLDTLSDIGESALEQGGASTSHVGPDGIDSTVKSKDALNIELYADVIKNGGTVICESPDGGIVTIQSKEAIEINANRDINIAKAKSASISDVLDVEYIEKGTISQDADE